MDTDILDQLGSFAEVDEKASELLTDALAEPTTLYSVTKKLSSFIRESGSITVADYLDNLLINQQDFDINAQECSEDKAAEHSMILFDDLEKTIEEPLKNRDGSWLVFFSGRRTGVAVAANSRSEAISKARKRKKRGGDKVVSARQLTASERKTAASGKWIKSRPPGFRPSMRGQGPKPKAAK